MSVITDLRFHLPILIITVALVSVPARAFPASAHLNISGAESVGLTERMPDAVGQLRTVEYLPNDAVGAGLRTSLQATDDRGRILVDNYVNTITLQTGDSFDDAQGFRTGGGSYRLTGVELGTTYAHQDSKASVVISEMTGAGHPGKTLYQLESPSNLLGRPFFRAPEDAFLKARTSYLVRIDVTAEAVGWLFTTDKTETDKGLSGWSFEDYFWTSSAPLAGLEWLKDETRVYALTLWGEERPDDFGETSLTAGLVNFSRHSGESPAVGGTINYESYKDWFNTSLSFDYGGRYRIDVMPVSLTNDDDIGVRAFYVNNPHHNSGFVNLEVEPVAARPPATCRGISPQDATTDRT